MAEIPPDFFNQTVCCPGYHQDQRVIPHPERVRPSEAVQEKSRTNQHHHFSLPPLPPPPPILLHPHDMFDYPQENTSSEYYESEFEPENDFRNTYYYTTKRPTTKLIGKGNKNTNSDIKKGPNNNNPTLPLTRNQISQESTRSEISYSNSNSQSNPQQPSHPHPKNITTTPLKKYKNPHHYYTSFNNQSQGIPKAEGIVPIIVPPPHLSAWNCPGRQMGMPRGHWPWMVCKCKCNSVLNGYYERVLKKNQFTGRFVK